MTNEEAIKILKSSRCSKEELREALAFALGVEAPLPPKGGVKEPSIFNQCRNVFTLQYNRYTGLRYNFGVKDGVALSALIKKLESISNSENVVQVFTAYVQNLPQWYKDKQFSLTVINSKFNEIIASISKKSGTNNGNSSEREAVRAAFAGANKP